MNAEYLKHFVVTGQIEVAPGFWDDYKIRRAYLAGSYLGPVPGHINPLQEVRADMQAVEAGGMTQEAFAAKHDVDFWPMLDEMREQYEAWHGETEEQQAETLKDDAAVREESGKAEETVKEQARSRRRRIFGGGRR